MRSAVAKLSSDLIGVARVCGLPTAARWAWHILTNLPAIIRDGHLHEADIRMGPGPFRVKHPAGTALLTSEHAFSGLREIWVRDVYGLSHDLSIGEGDVVVDLGGNVGNFSMLALAAAKTSRVVAVEALPVFNHGMKIQAELNGWSDRLTICNAFIGEITGKQENLRDITSTEAPTISEKEFLQRYKIERIDFLKCDIEGSEFAFLEPGSRILDISRQVAFELHGWGGDMNLFIETLKSKGFEILKVIWASNDCILIGKRKARGAPPQFPAALA